MFNTRYCDNNSKTSPSDRNSLQNAEVNVSEKFKKWESKCFLYDKNIIDDCSYGYFCRLKFCFTIQYFSFSAFDFAAAWKKHFHISFQLLEIFKQSKRECLKYHLQNKVQRSATMPSTLFFSWFSSFFFRVNSFTNFTSLLPEHPDTRKISGTFQRLTRV